MNKKVTFITFAIVIFFIGFVIIFMNKTISKSQSMDGMPGMSDNGDMEGMKDNKVHKIVQSDLLKAIDNPDAIIVDLREPIAYKKGHIPNSINIPFEDFQKRFQELDPEKNIILVCHMGSMGEASGQVLIQKGYQHVYNLSGGMAQWSGPLKN